VESRLEGTVVIYCNLDSLKKWAEGSLMEFPKTLERAYPCSRTG